LKSQHLKQIRIRFNIDRDIFLLNLVENQKTNESTKDWNHISEQFNQEYTTQIKTAKQLKNRHQNLLKENLKTGEFSNDEKELFQYLYEERHLSISSIAPQLNKSIQNVKNYKNRKYFHDLKKEKEEDQFSFMNEQLFDDSEKPSNE
jgi:predicted O-linked N-acetylglucosamine transferase (SPINDLY family)